jgi:isoleucyl-tRNA synthetase
VYLSLCSSARNRLEAFVNGRSEWCISRQRSWGVPIPALFKDGVPVMDTESIEGVISTLERHGIDYWWTGPDEAFDGVRGTDTLDVWFDSGSSWTLGPPADVYLEGSDQHRGWFQSSLLTHVGTAMAPKAPYKHLLTHGFINDESGKKMSKSDGNGLSPVDMVKQHGADTLRIWAASVDYYRDVSVGPRAVQHANEVLRKWRSVMRFMLANKGSRGEDYSLVSGLRRSQADQDGPALFACRGRP